jgi:hypothetical protein
VVRGLYTSSPVRFWVVCIMNLALRRSSPGYGITVFGTTGSQQAFLTGLAHLYNLFRISVGPGTPANVAWKSKEETFQHATSGSISKSSPLEAFDER